MINKKHSTILYLLILAASIVLLSIALVFFFKPPSLYRPVHRFWSAHSHTTLNANDANTIRPWMTFDYINKVFKLPADYLKSGLSISDPKYPNISLGSCAREKKINTTDFVIKVRDAVRNYLTPKT